MPWIWGCKAKGDVCHLRLELKADILEMAVLWRIADLVSTLSIIKKITGTDDIQPEKSSSKYRQTTKGEGKRLGVSAGNHE